MDYPQCKYLVDSGGMFKTCEIVANHTGGLSNRILPAMCQSTCKIHGPYCGKEISKEQEAMFSSKIFLLDFSLNKMKFLKRILNQYQLPVKIRYPEKEWLEIKKQLQPFIESGKISKIYLTGSLLLEKDSHKDFDILLKIPTWKDFKVLKEQLPTNILGVPCDYFFTSLDNVHDRIFCIMDCDDKILYTSSWYELKIEKIPDNIRLQQCKPLYINKYIEEELKRIISPTNNKNLSQEHIDGRANWKMVEDSWNKAVSFTKSILSRGLFNESVSEDILKLRKESCFGNKDKNLKECDVLLTDSQGIKYCGACGCGQRDTTRLNDIENKNSYTKLNYPYLECPLKKKGFNNYNTH